MKKVKPYLYFLLIGSFLYACGDSLIETTIEHDPIFNPYDTITYPDTLMNNEPLDSSTFLGLHYYIFSKRCNQPACHDGTFEPDFRTVQSAYNSLVFHPVFKNTPNDDYPYRVTPNDPSLSMMYKRISEHEPPNFEQMPSSGIALPNRQIELIRNWIADGAKDINGNPASQTSSQPNCYGVAAYLPNFNNQRIDTSRVNGQFSAFVAPANQNINFWFLYVDVNENGMEVLGNVLTHNTIKFSNDPYDFSNATTIQMNMGLKAINSVFSQPFGTPVPYYQNLTMKPSDYGFSTGDVVYFRTYVKDSDHTNPTEIPNSSSQFVVQAYFSMYLQ